MHEHDRSSGLRHRRAHVIVAHTTFGKGVSFMENEIDWHYLPMTDEQYDQALSELLDAVA